MEKTKYLVRISNETDGLIDSSTGTNKETLLRNAAKTARGSKTQHHWKNRIYTYVNLYKEKGYERGDKPIKTMRF